MLDIDLLALRAKLEGTRSQVKAHGPVIHPAPVRVVPLKVHEEEGRGVSVEGKR